MALNIPVFNSKDEDSFLSLGVGTESVKALIFQKEKGGIAVLKSFYEYLDEYGQVEGGDFGISMVKKAVSSIIGKVQQVKFRPKSILVELPANIIKAKIISADYKREDSKKIINAKEEINIYHAVFKDIKNKSVEDSTKSTGILAEDFEFLSLEILEITIDGYEVSAIQGFSGKNMNFKFLVTFVPKNYLKEIKDIFQELKLKNLKFFHEVQGLKYYAAAEKLTGVFVNIGGLMTKIFLVNKGKIEMVGDFEIGSHLFSSVLSENLGITAERARVLKENYSNMALSEEVRGKIQQFFLPSAKKWFSALKTELNKEKSLLPHHFFLFGGGSELPEIKEMIEKDDWRDVPYISQPEVKIIFPHDLKSIQDKNQILHNPREVSLLLLCYYVL